MTTTDQAATPSAGGDVAAFLSALARCSCRRSSVTDVNVEALADQGYVRVLHGVLGPVVTLGPLGRAALGLPGRGLAASSATDEVALQEAAALALSRGYVLRDVGTRSLRLADAHGREHVLYVRVSSGPPSTKWVQNLLRRHRSTLRRHASTLILVVIRPEKYVRQLKLQRHLQVWSLDQ